MQVNYHEEQSKLWRIIEEAGNEVLNVVYSNSWNFDNKARKDYK